MKKIAIVGTIVLVATLLAGSSVLAGSLLGGNAVIDRERADTYSNFTTIDTNNPFNFTGELTEWEIYAEVMLPVQLLIIRNLDRESGAFNVVAQSPLETPSIIGVNTFSLDTPLPVQFGDFIGVYHPQTGVVSYDVLEFDQYGNPVWAHFGDFNHPVLQTANNGGGGSPAILSCERVYSIRATGTASPSFSWGITYPEDIEVASSRTVSTHIETSEDIELHVSFKGEFQEREGNYWTGHWTYEEQTIFLEAGTHDLDLTFAIPYDLYVESLAGPDPEIGRYRFLAQNYYFYVFSTTPGGSWGTGSDNTGQLYLPGAGAVDTGTVIYPPIDDKTRLTTGVRMIKDKILPPSGQPDDWTAEGLDDGLRQSLLAKLDSASNLIERAYASEKLNRLNGAQGMIGAFINELESNNPASTYSKAGECVDLATFIVEWIKEAK